MQYSTHVSRFLSRMTICVRLSQVAVMGDRSQRLVVIRCFIGAPLSYANAYQFEGFGDSRECPSVYFSAW